MVEDDDPCPDGSHCCCCGVGEPCCDCGLVRPSASCIGEHCFCGKPAAKKVGEEIPIDDPQPCRHNLTTYVCAEHYAQLMGPLGAQQVGLPALTGGVTQADVDGSHDDLRRIIMHVEGYDTPSETDPRRRYTVCQIETAIRLAMLRVSQDGGGE